VPTLRRSGFKFSLTKRREGNYWLDLPAQPLGDLSFLKGAPISALQVNSCSVSDLAPLRDLPLDWLDIRANPISDLSPLRGLQLKTLYVAGTKIRDLSPLVGMPLKLLYLDHCDAIADLAPLSQIPTLETVTLPARAKNLDLLRGLP